MRPATDRSRLLQAIAIAVVLSLAYWQWRQITATESTRKAGNIAGMAENLCRDGESWPPAGTPVGVPESPLRCAFTRSVFVWDTETKTGSLECDVFSDTQPDRFFAHSKSATIDGRRCFVFRDGGVVLKDSEVDWSTHLRR